MQPLVRRDRSWLTRPRTVGTPEHWARQGALFGGLLGWLTPFALALTAAATEGVWLIALAAVFNPVLLAGGLVGATLGGAVGLGQPALLDRARGRVPLPLIAVGQAAVGSGVGAVTAGAMPIVGGLLYDVVLEWQLVGFMAAGGAVVGGVASLLAWLPVTVATVLGVRAWPVTASIATGIPAALLALLLILVSL